MTELHDVAGVPATSERHFDIRIRLDVTDYRQLLKCIRWTAVERLIGMLPWAALGALGVFVGIFVALFLREYFPSMDGPLGLMCVSGIAYLALFLIYLKVVLPAYFQAVLSGQTVGLEESRMIVDADGIVSEMPGLKSSMAWPLITRVIESERHVILMYSRLYGYVVPKRVFDTTEEASRFVAFSRAQATAAQ